MRSNEGGKNRWVEPPGGVQRYYNDVPDAIETLTQHNDFCKACYTVSRDIGVLATSRTTENAEKLQVFLWIFALADMVEGAEAGCHFCALFTLRYFINSWMMSGSRGYSRSDAACCSLAPRDREKNEDLVTAIGKLREFSEKNPEGQFTFVVEPLDYDHENESFCRVRFSAHRSNGLDAETFSKMVMMIDIDLEFFAVSDSAATERIKRQPFNTQPGSDKSVEQAKVWIEECLHQHEECPGFAEATLPSRVIEILDEENLVLRKNLDEKQKGSYTALSYCWGGPQDFATTTETISRNLQGFKVNEMAQSLQDGVSITRKLGLRYLWVDAMCIIQDSTEDKEREIPKMASYYSNSYVTLCAATPEKATEGFLQTRCECENHPESGLPFDVLHMPYLGQDGQYGKMLFRQPFPYTMAEENIERRAWPFQERVLSPRVLNYGVWTVWQCQKHQRSFGGVDEFSYDRRTFNYRPVQALIRKGNSTSDDATQGLPENIYDYWHQAVHAYSVRESALESDKLPAIGGLAAVFAQASGDEYLAGLWRGNLLRELLWSTNPDIDLAKPDEYRAPSWSWASCDNDITYDRLPPADARPIATIINCSVTPLQLLSGEEGSSFGRIASGTLELEGFLFRISGEITKKLLNSEFRHVGMNEFTGMFNPAAWDQMFLGGGRKKTVSNQDWEPPEKCAILPLFAVEVEGKGHKTSGLVIAEKEDGTYERIADFQSVMIAALETRLKEDLVKVVIV